MPKYLNHLFKKNGQRTKSLWGTEFNIVENGLDEKQVTAFIDDLITRNNNIKKAPIDSLQSLIERAIESAEKISTNIKSKEEDTNHIANQIIEEPESTLEDNTEYTNRSYREDSPVTQNGTDNSATSTPEETVLETENENLVQPETINKLEGNSPNSTEYTFYEQNEEINTQDNIKQLEETFPDQEPLENTKTTKTIFSHLSNLDKEALYTGEVELVINVPVNPVAVSKLYNFLQSTPDLKILYTRGSWDRGTNITVSLDKPLPLIGMIAKVPGIVVSPASIQEEKSLKVSTSSLLGSNRKDATRIDIALTES